MWIGDCSAFEFMIFSIGIGLSEIQHTYYFIQNTLNVYVY